MNPAQDMAVTYYRVTGFPALLILLAIGFLTYGWPAMKIARRAGKPAWLGLLMGIPLVNIVVIWVFAHSVWPKSDDEAA